MKKLLLLSILTLTACAGQHTQQTHDYLRIAIQKEMSGWETTQKLYAEECKNGDSTEAVKREKALDVNQCYEDLARKHVMPVAISPTDVNMFLLANKKSALAYKKGEIDRDELNIAINENWISYTTSMDNIGKTALNQAAQADAQLAQQRQQYFQGLSQQLMAQQQATQNNSTTTNCRRIGNSLNCETW